MTDLIGEGPITKSFLEKKLQEHFNTNAKLEQADGEVISKGMGFTSDVMRVNLKWSSNSENNVPSKVIIKAPKISNITTLMENFGSADAAAASAQFVPLSHATECRTLDLLTAHHVVPLPKIYGYSLITETDPGMIIMEDLGDRGGIINNIADGLTVDQWGSVVDAIADLHGWSLTTDAPWREVYPGPEMLMEMMKGFIQAGPTAAKRAIEKYPELSSVDLDDLTQKLDFDEMMKIFTYYKEVMPDVLIHGDMWANNIFFEKNADGSLSSRIAAFIDWQVCVKNCGVFDLTRFEGWCLNHEIRRKHATTMLHRYYDRLKAKCGDKFSTTFEQMEDIYKRSTAINGLFGIAGCEIFLTMIAKVEEDKTGWRKKEMLTRILAAYEDAMEIMSENNVTKTRL